MQLVSPSTALATMLTLAGCVVAAQAQTANVPPTSNARATQDASANALLQRYQSAKDPAEAQRAFDELATSAAKSPRAAYLCGVIAAPASSVVASRATAQRCLESAANSGIVEAQHALAVLLLEAKPGDPQQRAAAERLLKIAAKMLPESAYLLALLKADQAPDPERARQEVVAKAAQAGYAPAQYDFARRLYAQGSAESKAAAREWLDKAVAQHHAEATVELALLIESDGRSEDTPRIVALLEAASLAGSPRGDHALGLRLMKGQGVTRDNERAFELFRRAASRGNVPAMYATGFALSEGLGTGVDDAAAFAWFRRAADRGNADAMYAMGNSYANGWGVGTSPDVAFGWYCKAAKAGSAPAMEMVKRAPAGQCVIEPRQSKGPT